MCESCAYRPELVHCSQCRTPLFAPDGTEKLTRNRALEELARRTFPAVVGQSAGGRGRGPGNRGGRGRGGATTARVHVRVGGVDHSIAVRLLSLAGYQVVDLTE